MMGKVRTIDRRLLTRRCLGCGYDGSMLRGGQARRCPRCGCDLQKRPARSYAEMEGLLGQPLTIDAPLARPRQEENLIQRWLAVLFLAMVGLIAMTYLFAAMVV